VPGSISLANLQGNASSLKVSKKLHIEYKGEVSRKIEKYLKFKGFFKNAVFFGGAESQ
tara:strand:- start:250 stop:423 length:174 start_codon:yes stop_codon:yes gene_type:complete